MRNKKTVNRFDMQCNSVLAVETKANPEWVFGQESINLFFVTHIWSLGGGNGGVGSIGFQPNELNVKSAESQKAWIIESLPK